MQNIKRMISPLVSIVLPTYKRAHLLAQAIRSVLDQTYVNLELIIVDDNSPDVSMQHVRSIHQRVSYRFGAWLVQRGRARLKSRLAHDIVPLFARYQTSQASVGDTRAALLEIVGAHGTLAYVTPRT